MVGEIYTSETEAGTHNRTLNRNLQFKKYNISFWVSKENYLQIPYHTTL